MKRSLQGMLRRRATWGVVVLLLGVGLLATCRVWSDAAPDVRASSTAAPEVKVLLEGGASSCSVTLRGAYVVMDDAGRVLASGRALTPGLLRAERGRVALNGRSLGTASVRLRPRADDPFTLGDRNYAGDLLVRVEQGRLDVINAVDMETYVAGVLFSEMPRAFGRAALQAQSVAARSYAMWRLDQGRELLRPTEADQVYAGRGPLAEAARDIVRSTEGEILVSDGVPFCAYYSSTCGGGTSDVDDVFGGPDQPPLRGVRCRWCQTAPRHRWSRVLSTAELDERFGLGGRVVKDVQLRVDGAGRAKQVRLVGDGWERTFGGLEFRSAWNRGAPSGQDLPSALLLSVELGTSFEVRGGGYGHGVGMCQYGCRGLAKEGRSYPEILATYYPGSSVTKRW